MLPGWRIEPLGAVCDIVLGGTPKTGIPEYWNGDNLWITPAEMGDRITPYVDDTQRKITEMGLRDSSARMLPENSVILSTRAPIGHLVINTKPMATNQGCKSLIPKKEMYYKYLYYYLSSITKLLNALGSGATFKELSGSKLKEVKIPFPDFSEQVRIARLLDEALAAISVLTSSARANLKKLYRLSESYSESIFSEGEKRWNTMPLGQICQIKHGFAFKSEFFSESGEYVLLTPGNFRESGGYRDRGEKQKMYSGPVPDGYILSPGDLLVAMTEQAAGLLGSPILVPEGRQFLHNQRLGLVIPKPGVPWVNEFFFYALNAKTVRKAIHDGASGVKVRHTSPAKIGEVTVSFPGSVSEQRRIASEAAEFAREVRRLEIIYQRKLAALDELKKSLLHQAFSGNL